MMQKIYAASYAISCWSEWLFFAALAALFVIPFTALDVRFAAWCAAVLVAFSSMAARGISQAFCRALLRRHRTSRQFTNQEARQIEFLEQQERASQLAVDAGRQEAERLQQDVAAWWVNRNRF